MFEMTADGYKQAKEFLVARKLFIDVAGYDGFTIVYYANYILEKENNAKLSTN